MTPRCRLPAYLLSCLFTLSTLVGAPEPGPFFETDQPFFHTQLEVSPSPEKGQNGGNFVVRGVLIPLPSGHAVIFDQELMRVAGLWVVAPAEPPITLQTMAQVSYGSPRRKVGSEHPRPTGRIVLSSGMHPGVSNDPATLFVDPRPPGRPGDEGRGALPATFARFEGTELVGGTAALRYQSGGTPIREWFESRQVEGRTEVHRHFEIGPHNQPLHFVIGSAGTASWTIADPQHAHAELTQLGELQAVTNSPAFTLSVREKELLASLAPAAEMQRVSVALVISPSPVPASSPATPAPSPTAMVAPSATPTSAVPAATNAPVAEPAAAMPNAGEAASTTAAVVAAPRATLPLFEAGPTPVLGNPGSAGRAPRWPQSATAPVQLAGLQQNGLILDRIAVPEENPWNRRVRAADIAFLTNDRAAVVTYDGDVWFLDGLADEAPAALTWHRFASGLHEPLAIAAPGGVIQVATKNGVVRVHDRDGNGEADWFENFNDHMLQSETTRSFPLDMAVAPDGSTYLTQGGIVTQSGIASGGTGTAHTGGILKISPDGRSSQLFARNAREPFIAVHPVTGLVTGTDQQGHYIPSSVSYIIREGDSFGFLEKEPAKLTPPLVWIPHDQDSSSSSETWMVGAGLGPWDNKLLHLSYGTGRMFIISPDLDAPVPQAAVIPLDLKTDLPLLHARMHPRGDAVFLAGFQIWGTRTTTWWGLGRLRPGKTPIVTALAARSSADGVVLTFAEPINPELLKPENVGVRVWNYKRSSDYGSGRYTPEGTPGTTQWPVGQVVPSADRKSVFIHLPKLPPVMQVEVRHDFALASGAQARGVVYLTIHGHHPMDLAKAGFNVDLSKSVAVVALQKEEPATRAMGKALSESLGCAACHSPDGVTEGRVGPTWKNLFGSTRTFVDGTTEVADELYLREKILDPMKKRVTTGSAEMPSYRGVVSEQQLDALVLYIKSLRPGVLRKDE